MPMTPEVCMTNEQHGDFAPSTDATGLPPLPAQPSAEEPATLPPAVEVEPGKPLALTCGRRQSRASRERRCLLKIKWKAACFVTALMMFWLISSCYLGLDPLRWRAMTAIQFAGG